MRTVHRFKLSAVMNEIEMPKGAEIIGVGLSGKLAGLPEQPPADEVEMEEMKGGLIPVVNVFALVDTGADMVKRTFLNVPVGQALPENGTELAVVGVANLIGLSSRIVFEILPAKKAKK